MPAHQTPGDDVLDNTAVESSETNRGAANGSKNSPEERQPLSAQAPVPSSALVPRQPPGDVTLLPTLVPAPVANLITALSTSARVSLRVTAFFIEAMLESSQYTTRLSLAYTRRLLVAAVSSARRVYLLSNAAFEGDLLSIMGMKDGPGEDGSDGNGDHGHPALVRQTDGHGIAAAGRDKLLQVLDKYTNLGIYVIHHAFTLAELFAMSSFYLTHNAISSAHHAAQESVALFDSLFGSNESSRALSSIISLVRKEVLEDERLLKQDGARGKIGSLAALTRTMTAFACLQGATWQTTSKGLRMKRYSYVTRLYDCTVEEEKLGSTRKRRVISVRNNLEEAEDGSKRATQAIAGPGPSTLAHRQARAQEDSLNWNGLADEAARQLSNTEGDEAYDPSGPMTEHGPLQDSVPAPATSADGSHIHLYDRSRRMSRIEDELYEVIEDVTESSRTSQVFETIGERGEHVRQPVHIEPAHVARRRSDSMDVDGSEGGWEDDEEPLVTVSHRSRVPTPSNVRKRSTSTTSAASTEIDWMEVDDLLGPEGDPDDLDQDRIRTHPSTPTPQGNGEYVNPNHEIHAQRIQFVLRTMTTKILQRSRTVRKVPTEEMPSIEGDDPRSVPGGIAVEEDVEMSDETGGRHRHREDGRNVMAREKPLRPSASPTTRQISPPVDKANLSPTSESGDSLFPHDTLVRNIHRFMRYSSAAYGQSFLRILRLGETDYKFSSTTQHHANSWAFVRIIPAIRFGQGDWLIDQAEHTKIPIEDLLLSSYVGSTPTFARKAPPLVHYIAVEHTLKAIVLTCRGTLGLSDVLVDLTCEYCDIPLEGADPLGEYYVHKGMYRSAVALTDRKSTVHGTLVDALTKYPSYGLVITGHSLGGGVAALLAILLATPSATFMRDRPADHQDHSDISTPFVTSLASGLPPGRPIHCYAYGPPAVASLDLAKYAQGLISSVVHGTDIVPCLSLGCLRDLRNVAVTLSEEGHLAEEIVARVVGLYRGKLPKSSEAHLQPNASPLGSEPDDQGLQDWMISLIKTMRADMDNDKLYPPGTAYIIVGAVYVALADLQEYKKVDEDRPAGLLQRLKTTKHSARRKVYRVVLRQCDNVAERFRERELHVLCSLTFQPW